MKHFLFASAFAASSTLAAAAPPTWTIAQLGSKPADTMWSEPYYAVAEGAVRPRLRAPDESAEESARLDLAWEDGIRTYLRRVSNMVAGMNLPEDAERAVFCDRMAALVSERFVHLEGRQSGFAMRQKPDLVRACANRAFLLSGFFAEAVRAVAVSPDRVTVSACYFHDQFNDPTVVGQGRVLLNGRRAVTRVAVEVLSRGSDGIMRIDTHNAHDVPPATLEQGCQAR